MYCTLDRQLLEHNLHHYCCKEVAKSAVVKMEHIEVSILKNVDDADDAGDYHTLFHIQTRV